MNNPMFYLAVHEHIVCAESSVNHAKFIHELQGLEDFIRYPQHLLWAEKENMTVCHCALRVKW